MDDLEYRERFGKSREDAINDTKNELIKAMRARDKTRAKELAEKLKKAFVGDDVLWANEVAANIMVATVMIILSVILVLTIILSKAGVFKYDATALIPMCSICIGQMVIGIIINTVFKAEKRWLKYLLNIQVCLTIACVTSLMGFRAAIAFAIPVVISIRYFSEKFTRIIAIISGVIVLTSTVASAYIAVSPNLHALPIPDGTVITVVGSLVKSVAGIEINQGQYVKRLLLESYLPNLMQFLVIAIISIKVAKWGHNMVNEQATVAAEFSRVDTELKMASNIQSDVLPNIFPAFPSRSEIDVYAKMDPAKEVGGDFYDYFFIDADHLGIVIADVSGKGVPAALFMMIGKALIKNQAQLGVKPSEVFNNVNRQLCENNETGLFITAWLGILEISTGILTACNAGHELPIIKRDDGHYELFKDPHGFVLAGMEETKYRDYQIKLRPTEMLYIYTDGATEATNSNDELFGVDRLMEALNQSTATEPKQMLEDARAAIDTFVGDAPQFDDITMVGVKYCP